MKSLVLILLCLACGCVAVAKKTIQATGTVAEASLKMTGQVAKTAAGTTLDVASTAFKKGVVTVIDNGTGVSRKVPWDEGLRVSKFQAAGRIVEVLRGAQKIKTTDDTILRAGDVVRLN